MDTTPRFNNNQINSEIEEKNESIDYIVQKNQTYITSLKIYKCIFSYLEFLQNLKENLENNKKPIYTYIFLIDESWLNNFKKICSYNLIEKSIKNKKKLSSQDYKILINDFAKKYPLSPEVLENFPKKPKHISEEGDKKDYYFDDYEFIDEKTMNIFKDGFNNNIDKLNKFNKRKIIIKYNLIILLYNNHLEIIKYDEMIKKERLLFSVDNKNDINIIKDEFINYNYDTALINLKINDKNNYNQIVKDKNDNKIGTMIKIKRKNNVIKQSLTQDKANQKNFINKKKINENFEQKDKNKFSDRSKLSKQNLFEKECKCDFCISRKNKNILVNINNLNKNNKIEINKEENNQNKINLQKREININAGIKKEDNAINLKKNNFIDENKDKFVEGKNINKINKQENKNINKVLINKNEVNNNKNNFNYNQNNIILKGIEINNNLIKIENTENKIIGGDKSKIIPNNKVINIQSSNNDKIIDNNINKNINNNNITNNIKNNNINDKMIFTNNNKIINNTKNQNINKIITNKILNKSKSNIINNNITNNNNNNNIINNNNNNVINNNIINKINNNKNINNNNIKNINNIIIDKSNKNQNINFNNIDINKKNINNQNNYIKNINENNNINKNNIIDKNIIFNNNINNNINISNKKNNNLNKDIPLSVESIQNINFNIISTHTKGLNNIGDTGLMNALLQCFAYIEKFTKYFLNKQSFEKLLSNKIKYKLTNAYAELLYNLWLNNNINSYSPEEIINIIKEINPLITNVQISDSKNFILFFMETIHDELNKANFANNSFQLNQFRNQYNYEQTFNLFCNFFSNNYQSKISDLFYGMYNKMMQCLNCGIVIHNVQCFYYLTFPLDEVKIFKNKIENDVNIIECFENYQKGESMEGDNQIFCNNCQTMANCFNSSKLLIVPQILMINIIKGEEIILKLEEHLNIQNFVYYTQSPNFYELIGIVTYNNSNYIAFCKSFVDHNWYKYNNHQVENSSFNEANSTGIPYILIYSSVKLNN